MSDELDDAFADEMVLTKCRELVDVRRTAGEKASVPYQKWIAEEENIVPKDCNKGVISTELGNVTRITIEKIALELHVRKREYMLLVSFRYQPKLMKSRKRRLPRRVCWS